MAPRLPLLAALLLLGAPRLLPADAFTSDGLIKADVAQLKDTRLVAHPNVPIPPDTNVIWCGTLQLAWNEAIKLVGERLQFENQPPLVNLLNRQDFTANDLDPAGYVALADFERNHVEAEIRAALQKTFHGAASPELIPDAPQPTPGPDNQDFVAYAYLFKNLAFAHPFNDNDPIPFAGVPVRNFGSLTHGDNLSPDVFRQISIYDYQSDDNFILTLQTKALRDQLILAKLPPGPTLQATIDAVLKRIAANQPQTAGESDPLAVPKINLDLKKDFDQLEGLKLNPSPAAKIQTRLTITKAQQLIRFQLNEKGAVLKSEAVMVMKALAMMPSHNLIFDKPFLILMKRADAPQPYFALWIGNASLLIPAK
jgi:hypothetical protein